MWKKLTCRFCLIFVLFDRTHSATERSTCKPTTVSCKYFPTEQQISNGLTRNNSFKERLVQVQQLPATSRNGHTAMADLQQLLFFTISNPPLQISNAPSRIDPAMALPLYGSHRTKEWHSDGRGHRTVRSGHRPLVQQITGLRTVFNAQ